MGDLGKFAGGFALGLAMGFEARRLLGLSLGAAKRDMKSRDWNDDQLHALITQLDQIARSNRDDSDQAADLCDYAEELLRRRSG